MSKMSKKMLSMALAAAMLLSACGSTTTAPSTQETPSTPSASTESSVKKGEPLKDLAIAERAANELESLIIMNTQVTAVSDEIGRAHV